MKSFLVYTAPAGVLRYIKKRYYRRMLERQGDRDQPEFVAIRALVRPGETVIDVGANIGLFTCFLSRLVGDDGVVHSIEPVPVTYDILANSVDTIGLRNVRLWNVAASDHEGTGQMEVPTYPGRSRRNFYRAAIVPQGGTIPSLSYRVNLTSLDALADVVDSAPSFIKVDVEGHELAVIAGAMKLIATSKPSMLIEVAGDMDDPRSAAADLSGRLRRHGYAPYWIDGSQLRRRQAGVTSVNYFYLTTAHLQKVHRLLKND